MDFMEFINSLGVGTVPALVVIAFGVGLICKNIPTLNDKWIPAICLVAGAVFGVLALYTGMVGFEPTDWITALAVGIVSGLGAVGVHQLWKQLFGKDSGEETDETVAALVADRQRLLALVAEYEAKQEATTEAFVAEQEVE